MAHDGVRECGRGTHRNKVKVRNLTRNIFSNITPLQILDIQKTNT
jgi:hypothetical protein